jgi:antitoxin ParD1/3/4
MNKKASTMSVSLPAELKKHVQERVKQEHYGTPSDYIRSLIREDLKRGEQERLEAMLLEGLASGEARPMTKKDWQELRAEVRRRIMEQRRKK